MNGIGYYNCSYAEAGSNCTTLDSPLTFDLTAGGKSRLRLIDAGTHAMFRVSADNHPLNVTEADSIGVSLSETVHRVPLRERLVLSLSLFFLAVFFFEFKVHSPGFWNVELANRFNFLLLIQTFKITVKGIVLSSILPMILWEVRSI